MFPPNSNEAAILAHSRHTEHVLDDGLISGFKERVMTHIAQRMQYNYHGPQQEPNLDDDLCHLRDHHQPNWKDASTALSSWIVCRLGQPIFSLTTVMDRGITTTPDAGNSHLRKGAVLVQLEQRPGKSRSVPFNVDLDERESAERTPITLVIALIATPQQDGLSGQDRQTLAVMI